MTEKSETVKWIDAAFHHKRKRRVKNHKQLVSIDTHDPTSTDILENVLDNFYPQRPRNMDDVCLYDFIKWYEYSETDWNRHHWTESIPQADQGMAAQS